MATPNDIEDRWYLRHGSHIVGPLSSATIRRHLLEGRLQLSDLVSRDGTDWQSIETIDEVLPRRLRGHSAIDRQAFEGQQRDDRRRALLSISVSLGIVLLAIATAIWLGNNGTGTRADCQAESRPGVNWSSCNLDGLVLLSASLRGANLQNTSLVKARLNDANLTDADLSYANLTGAQLGYAHLAGARLLGADLRGTDLSNADLSNADLTDADLTEARLGGAILEGARLAGAIWLDGARCAPLSIGRCQ